ncbi:MAG TPA: hypothetical protein VGT24_09405 [Candidatus Acidoferrales bacterium]|nr:hypothetical protein [Candidatus Acidoferrales bacterium]
MGTTNFYTVRWHFEIGGKKAAHIGGAGFAEEHQDHISAAANDAATITAVLVTKYGATPTGAVLVIDSVGNAGPGTANT